MPSGELVVPTSAGAAGVTLVTIPTLVNRARVFLEDVPYEDYLTVAVGSTGATTVTTNNPTMWGEGDVMEVDDASGALYRVLSTPTVNPVSVKPAYDGSPDTAHAVNAVLRKNPRYRYVVISEAATRLVASELWPRVWVRGTTSITPSPTTTIYYALPSDFEDIETVSQQTTSTITDVTTYSDHGAGQKLGYEIVRGTGTTISSTQMAIRFPMGFDNLTNTVTITYRARVTATTIPEGEIGDLIVTGTVARVLAIKDATTAAGDPKQPQAQPGEMVGSATWWWREFLSKRVAISANNRRLIRPARVYIRG